MRKIALYVVIVAIFLTAVTPTNARIVEHPARETVQVQWALVCPSVEGMRKYLTAKGALERYDAMESEKCRNKRIRMVFWTRIGDPLESPLGIVSIYEVVLIDDASNVEFRADEIVGYIYSSRR